MKYEEVKTPEELLLYMDKNINFGFVDEDGIIYDSTDNKKLQLGYLNKWRLSSPKRLIEVKYGNCYDQVELERDWFCKHGYDCRTFYICFVGPYDGCYSNHAFLVFENSGKYYSFEHSAFNDKGINEFSTFERAVEFQKLSYIKRNKQMRNISSEEL